LFGRKIIVSRQFQLLLGSQEILKPDSGITSQSVSKNGQHVVNQGEQKEKADKGRFHVKSEE